MSDRIKKMIRVGIECESLEDGQYFGVARNVSKLLEEITKHPELGQEFKFILYFKSKIPKLPYLESPIFEKILVYPSFLPSSFSLYYYFFLPVRLYFKRADVVYFPNYMLPLIFLGKSMVTLTEDVYYEMNGKDLPFRYKLAYKIFCNWAARRATRVIAVSESSKKALTEVFKIKSGRISVVSNAIEAPEVSATKINHSENENYILYLGQALPRRHLKETIMAFEQISPKFPGLRFIVVAKDKYRPPIIKKTIQETNDRLGIEAIDYKEYVKQEELERIFLHARSLVYVSSKEAFGLPPLEALAHGVAPVVSDSETTREIFGDNAFFVTDPESIDSIARAIIESLTDKDKRRKIFLASDRIVSRFSWRKHLSDFLEAVSSAISITATKN